jgi:hypothetical protein
MGNGLVRFSDRDGELADFAGVPVTKNMVIGKRDRLGLPQRREGSPGRRGDRRPHEYRPPGLEPSKPRTMEPIAPHPPITVEVPVSALIQMFPAQPPVTNGVLLRDSDHRFEQCRFIADDAKGFDTVFCGKPIALKPGPYGMRATSWCAEHLARVEAPPREHSKRRAA